MSNIDLEELRSVSILIILNVHVYQLSYMGKFCWEKILAHGIDNPTKNIGEWVAYIAINDYI